MIEILKLVGLTTALSTLIMGVLTFLLRSFFTEKIKNSIKGDYDRQLAAYKSELNKQLEKYKQELSTCLKEIRHTKSI